jgi:cell division protein FtsB
VAKADKRSASKRRPPQPKRPARTRKIIHVLVLFVAALIVLDALVGDQGLFAMLQARRQYDELQATIARQRDENARLRDQARRLADDPATIEEVARRELGLIKPGEKVFIVKDVPAPAKQ